MRLKDLDRLQELCTVSTQSSMSSRCLLLVQVFILRLLLHLLHVLLVLTSAVTFGTSSNHGPAVGGSLVAVASVGLAVHVLVLDHHQVGRHLLELIDQPLALHLSQDPSLIVVPAAEKTRNG